MICNHAYWTSYWNARSHLSIYQYTMSRKIQSQQQNTIITMHTPDNNLSTPQQNGVVERKNRYLLDVVRTLLLESFVPPRFWCETLSTVVHLIIRLPSPTLQNFSPFLKLFGHSFILWSSYFWLCLFYASSCSWT